MARWKENDCVGCPQGCSPYCNRKKDYWVYECDWCGFTTTEIDIQRKFEYRGKWHVCEECYEKWTNEEVDDNGKEYEERMVY